MYVSRLEEPIACTHIYVYEQAAKSSANQHTMDTHDVYCCYYPAHMGCVVCVCFFANMHLSPSILSFSRKKESQCSLFSSNSTNDALGPLLVGLVLEHVVVVTLFPSMYLSVFPLISLSRFLCLPPPPPPFTHQQQSHDQPQQHRRRLRSSSVGSADNSSSSTPRCWTNDNNDPIAPRTRLSDPNIGEGLKDHVTAVSV